MKTHPYKRAWETEFMEKDSDKKQRKLRSVIRSMYTPIFPNIIKSIYLAMLIMIPVSFIAELFTTLQGRTGGGLVFFIQRSSVSMIGCWVLFGASTVLLSIIQIVRLNYGVYCEMIYLFEDEIPTVEVAEYTPVNYSEQIDDAALILYKKESKDEAVKKYKHYLMTSLITGAASCLYFLISQFIF